MKKIGQSLYAGILLLAVGFLIYANALHGEFQFDDKSFILENDRIRDLADLQSIGKAFTYSTRVIPFLSFAVNFYLGGHDPFGYHLVNIMIHILNAFMVFLLARLILSLPNAPEGDKKDTQTIAFLAALVFLTHPLQTQAVSYVSQRFASMAMLFYILSVYFFIKARVQGNNKRLFLCSFVAGVCAVFSKEISFTLPLILIAADYCLILNSQQREKIKEEVPWMYVGVLLFLFTPLLLNFNYGLFLGVASAGNSDQGKVDAVNYLLTQFRVIPHYLWLFIYPFYLNFDYDFPLSHSLFEPDTLMGLALIVFLIYVGGRLLRKEPIVTFCILWFFITLSIESSVIPLPHVIFEHRVYLPSVGLCIFLVTSIYRVLPQGKLNFVFWAVLIALLGYLTHERNKVWQTEVALWTDVIQKSPEKSRGYDNLGAALIKTGQYTLAKPHLLKALSRNNHNSVTQTNLAHVYVYEKKYQEARRLLFEVLKKRPKDVKALNNLALIYKEEGDYIKAEVLLKETIKLGNITVEPFLNLANVYRSVNREQEAINLLEKAAERFSSDEALFILLEIQFRRREIEKARKIIDKISAMSHSPEFFVKIGSLCAREGFSKEAVLFFREALKKDPHYARTYIELGKFWGNAGQFTKAIDIWQKGIKKADQKQKEELLSLIGQAREFMTGAR